MTARHRHIAAKVANAKFEQMNLQISTVTSRTMGKFIDFPYRLYRHQAAWVPPLRLDIKTQLSPAKNPFFRHADHTLLLAARGREIVGRIAVFHNRKHNRTYGANVGMFGYLDMIDDPTVTAALLDAAASWLGNLGATDMLGPFSPDINGTMGILLDAFESPPMILMAYNAPYYAGHMDAAGMQKEKDVFAYEMGAPDKLPSRLIDHLAKVEARGRFTIRQANMQHFDKEVEIIHSIYNQAWSENWGALPMDEDEFAHLAADLKLLVDPELLHIAEVDGRPAGFVLALPDINHALMHVRNGRLFPLGLLKLLWHKRHISAVRVITMGVLKEYRHLGIEAAFYLRTMRNAISRGYVNGEMSWILEDNAAMNNGLIKLGARVTKTYRIYRRPINQALISPGDVDA